MSNDTGAQSAEDDAPRFGSCADLADLLGIERREGFLPAICCDSCHDDWDEGYDDPSEVERGGKTYFVCCAMLRALDDAPIPPAGTEA